MELSELLLKREELPILGNTPKIFFKIPLHPKLLDNSLNIDRGIAQGIFPEVVERWYEYLVNNTNSNNEEKKWINNIFLERDLNERRDKVFFMDNGFVKRFSIDDDKSGSLYFNKQVLNYKSPALTFLNFSEEKYKEFSVEKGENNIFVYSETNIDNFPKALLLRNWAIKYMNEVFKSL